MTTARPRPGLPAARLAVLMAEATLPVSTRAPLGRMIAAQTRAELRLALRRGESVLITLIVPPVLLAFFGLVVLMPVRPERRVHLLVPGILALRMIWRASVRV